MLSKPRILGFFTPFGPRPAELNLTLCTKFSSTSYQSCQFWNTFRAKLTDKKFLQGQHWGHALEATRAAKVRPDGSENQSRSTAETLGEHCWSTAPPRPTVRTKSHLGWGCACKTQSWAIKALFLPQCLGYCSAISSTSNQGPQLCPASDKRPDRATEQLDRVLP